MNLQESAAAFIEAVKGLGPAIGAPYFESQNVRAGAFLLGDISLDAEAFVTKALTGKIPTPSGDLNFRE